MFRGIPVLPGALVIVLALSLTPLSAAHAENVLRWAAKGDALTFDPHAQNETPTITGLHQVYETLTSRSPGLALVPQLAVSWEAIEPTIWEFKLRTGVKFHDGTPFTAADVVFSLNRALHEHSDYRPLIIDIGKVEAKDELTVRIHTKAPTPLLPANLTNVFMMSKAWSEKHGVEKPQAFHKQEENYAVRNANGTGPFIMVRREPGIRTQLKKNPDWWGLKEEPHNIDRIVFTPIDNNATRVAALLSGEIDFLLDPPLQNLAQIERASGLKTAQVPQIRTIFFGLAQKRKELLHSNVKGKNPFADKRVRQAVYQAINIDAIHKKIMRGLSVPAGMLIAPGVNGYSEELDKRLPYDPKAAKALLEEAGYPDGFQVKLDCPNDRYMNDEPICQAVVGMLGRIGIKVNLDAQPKSLHFPKIDNRETDFYMQGWGVPTLDSEYVFSFLYVTGRRNNGTEYSNKRLDSLAASMARELDPEKRDPMIREAWEIALDDIVLVPLHHQVIVWAMRENFDMPVTANNTPQFRWGRFR
jgi:peptide/nickel transport system substrate-binding protein